MNLLVGPKDKLVQVDFRDERFGEVRRYPITIAPAVRIAWEGDEWYELKMRAIERVEALVGFCAYAVRHTPHLWRVVLEIALVRRAYRWLRRFRRSRLRVFGVLRFAGVVDRELWGYRPLLVDALCTAALLIAFCYFASVIVRAAWAWTHGGF